MKRNIIFLLVLTFLFSMTMISSYALDNPQVVSDTRKLPEKSFTPAKISDSIGLAAATGTTPYWSVKVNYNETGDSGSATSDSYTDSTKSARYAIDYIYASIRVYEHINDALVDSAEDSHTDASHAGASAQGTFVYNDYAYGNHIFEEEGYQTWTPETYDD